MAMAAFEAMDARRRDAVSVGALMTALIHHENDAKALALYDEHSEIGGGRTAVLFALALKAAAKMGGAARGKNVHSEIPSSVLRESSHVRSTLIDFYGNVGELATAQNVFAEFKCENLLDITALNALMSVLLHNERPRDLNPFNAEDKLRRNYVAKHSQNIALQYCAALCDVEKGRAIHAQLIAGDAESDEAVRGKARM